MRERLEDSDDLTAIDTAIATATVLLLLLLLPLPCLTAIYVMTTRILVRTCSNIADIRIRAGDLSPHVILVAFNMILVALARAAAAARAVNRVSMRRVLTVIA